MIYFKKKSEGPTLSGSELLKKIEELRQKVENTKECFDFVGVEVPVWVKEKLTSRRRELATQRVATSLALMDGDLSLKKTHWERALEYTHWPFSQLQKDLI